MKKKTYPKLQQTVYHDVLPNGMNLHLLPRPGFAGYCGVLSIPFGSLHSQDALWCDGKNYHLKQGVAHFLEHRIFENNERKMDAEFMKTGTKVNAYTSYDQTVYHFSGDSNLKDNIYSLLEFVQQFSVTTKNVENEKKIIIQELLMYNDNPDYRLQRGMLENLYHYHAIKQDIGGNESEVSAITPELLMISHQAFYNPKKMHFTISGDFDTDNLRNFMVESQRMSGAPSCTIRKVTHKEPLEVVREFKLEYSSISIDKCCFGIKIPPLKRRLSPTKRLRQLMQMEILLQMLFSSSTPFYTSLLNKKLITSQLNSAFEQGDGFYHVAIWADVLDYEAFLHELKHHLQTVEWDETHFELIRRQLLGETLREAEHPESLAIDYGDNIIKGMDVLEKMTILQTIHLSELYPVLHMLRECDTSVYVLKRRETND